MKKALLYSASVLLLASVACNKTDSVIGDGDASIRFAPATESTRALVYASTLNAETFRVYDFKDGEKYLDNQIKYGTTGWVYVDEQDYLWKADEHKLFGYSTALGALPETKKITLAKVLTTSAANQADLLYSETVNVSADTWKHTSGNTKETPVTLNMKHLFAAVSMAVKNGKTDAIVLNTCTVPQIANSSTATIDYSGTAVAVSNTTPTAGDTPFVAGATVADVNLTPNALLDILTQAVASPTAYVVWPQTIPAMTIAVTYTMNDRVYETTATIPSVKWEAGKLYQYTLVIGNADDILLNFTVKDWEEGATENYEFE